VIFDSDCELELVRRSSKKCIAGGSLEPANSAAAALRLGFDGLTVKFFVVTVKTILTYSLSLPFPPKVTSHD
jgi:hypothetical protein